MKLHILVCVFFCLVVMGCGASREYPLVNGYFYEEADCVRRFPDDETALLCTNYAFGILKNDVYGEPKFNYKKFIALMVEYSVLQHKHFNPNRPILDRRALLVRAKYCRRIKSSYPLDLLRKAENCMAYINDGYKSDKGTSRKYNLNKFSSEVKTNYESKDKPAPIFPYTK